jgi:hypothetical protein
MMFKIVLSIGLLACYSIAKSVDLPSDDQVDPKDVEDPEVPDLSEVIREVENIQETFLRKLSEEMQKIDSKLQKIRVRHEEELKHFEKEPTAEKEGERKMPEEEEDSKMPKSEEDLNQEGEPKLTEEQQTPEKKENLPKETTIQVKEPENVIIEVRVPGLPESTKPEEKAPVEEHPELGVKELEEERSTTQKSLEKVIEEIKEKLEQPEDDKLPKMESGEEKGEQESEETPVKEEKKMNVSSSESSESSEEASDLITAPSGSSIIISVPAEYQEEGNVNIEVIPREGQEFLNPQPEDLRLAEGQAPSTEASSTESITTEAPSTEVSTTEAPSTEAPSTEVSTTEAPSTEAPSTEVPTTEAPTRVPTTEVTKEAAAELPTQPQMTTEVPVQPETTAAQVPREEFTTETTTATETTTIKEKESSTEGSKLLPPGNTIIITLSTDHSQPEQKEIVIDIEIPKQPCLDEKSSIKPTEEQTPEPTTSRPAKTTRRPTEGKKRPSGKRCPIGYQFNIYTLECTIQPNYASNYATGFGTYYWSMSQSPSSLTPNNPFKNLFGLRK